jgi:putative regulator of septum formation
MNMKPEMKAPTVKTPKVAAPKVAAPKVAAPKVPAGVKAPAGVKKAGAARAKPPRLTSGGKLAAGGTLSPGKVVVLVLLVLGTAGAVFVGAMLLKKASTGPVTVSVFALKVGYCTMPPTQVQANLATIEKVSCTAPHTQEVYALVKDTSSGDNYPGTDVLRTFANGNCLQQFAGYVGVPYQSSTLFYTYLLPSPRSWAAGDRTVDCVITTTGQELTHSVKGSKL